MTTIGFTKSRMPEERRVALLPQDVAKCVNPAALKFEEDYALHLGICDLAYERAGARIVSSREAYNNDIVCIPKPWSTDIKHLQQGQTATGWFYLAEKKELAQATISKGMTVIAWQDMYDAQNNYTFEKNRWFAGYIAVQQALPFATASPKRLNIGVLGTENGRVARGALARLKEEGLQEGVHYHTFGRHGQEEFKRRLPEFDVVISCGYYDPTKGYLLTLTDTQEMKSEALLIDACSDGIEGSEPHPEISPIFHVGRFNRIRVWNNNHSPSVWPLEVSEGMSEAFLPHLNDLLEGKTNSVLERATTLKQGEVIDKRINTLLGK